MLFASCDMFGTDLKAFFEEQKGGIKVGQAAPVAGKVALGTDGYVCLQAGEEGFSIPISNPLGYELRVETSFERTFGTIDGVTASAAGTDSLTVSIPPGQSAGNEGILHIKVTTAKEGRVLYEGDTGIAYLDLGPFTQYLKIEPSAPHTLSPAFDPGEPRYSITNAQPPFSLKVTAVAPEDEAAPGPNAPLITIDGAPGRGVLNKILFPAEAFSIVAIRVERGHGVAARDYAIEVTRAGAAGVSLAVAQEPDKKVYLVQDEEDKGIEPEDLESLNLNYIMGSAVIPLAPGQCDYSYDFTSPGARTVTVSYRDNNLGMTSSATYTAWVAGFAGITASGPGYAPSLAFNPSGVCDLGTVDYTVNELSIAADTGFTADTDVTLTIGGGAADSDGTKTIPLDDDDNTIEIKVIVNKGSYGTETVTRTIKISRASLADKGAFYVAGPGGTLPAGDDANPGSQAAPYATVAKALAMIHQSGLGAVPDTEFTIIVSGEITADTGGSGGMVEIGSGYPHLILKGFDTGTNAIDATDRNKRVLFISNGGNVTLEDNLTLTGGSASEGGGVLVYAGGTFTMTGGVIQGNNASYTGGGVYVDYNGIFTMTGTAVIKGNTAFSFGGGVLISGAFTMTGGVIEGNETTSGGGGGVYVSFSNAGTFTKTGGTIAGIDAELLSPPLLPNIAWDGWAVRTEGGKWRDTTAGTDITGKLYAKYTFGPGWGYVDPVSVPEGGAGDTTNNWEPYP
jgi:hypothetical protein